MGTGAIGEVRAMRLERITFEEAWPYINRKAIFWDAGEFSYEFLRDVAYLRNMEIHGTRGENGQLIHAAWTFADERQVSIAPLARELGVWHARGHAKEWRVFWNIWLANEWLKGTQELYGICLEKNKSMTRAVLAVGGRVYNDFCEVGGKRCVLQSLRKENYYGINIGPMYDINVYKQIYGV